MDDPNTTTRIPIPRPVIDISPVPNEPPTDVVHSPAITATNDDDYDPFDVSYDSQPTAINNNLNIISQTSTTTILQDKFVRLYHEDKSYMVLQEYCLPVTTVNPNLCKYPYRNCVVRRAKLLDCGTKLDDISPTVYQPDLSKNNKLSYTKLDSRYVQCYMPNCVDSEPNTCKIFHFSCHIHNLNLKAEEGFKIVQYKGGNDILLDQVKNNDEELKERIKVFPSLNTKLIFPMCSKRCFNSLEKMRKKQKEAKKQVAKPAPKKSKQKVKDSETPAIWDKDGTNDKKSSIRVLIDWLTTEGNLSNYYGGLDKHGVTNANRKETYHNLLAENIKKENGSVRTPQSIRNKIVRIIKTYNTAQFRLNTTGAGMVGTEYDNFQDEVVNKHCIYYHELKPILADRPNVTPWATNFDSEDEGDENVKKDSDNDSSDDESHATSDSVIEIISIDDDEDNCCIISKDKISCRENLPASSQSFSQLADDTCSKVSKRNVPTKLGDASCSSTSMSPTNRKRQKCDSLKMSPADANRAKKSLLRQGKKQICGSNAKSKSKLGALMDAEKQDRLFILESRKQKMEFEKKRHHDLKQMEIKKLNEMKEIENKKIALQEKLLVVDVEEKELKKDQLRAQTEIEKNNLLLVKMKVLEKQIEMREKNNSEMNDGLDDLFNK